MEQRLYINSGRGEFDKNARYSVYSSCGVTDRKGYQLCGTLNVEGERRCGKVEKSTFLYH
jgi:hypothetical protein